MSKRPIILVIGPTPPPFHGVSVATESVLNSHLCERFQLEHLDLSDRRGIQHVDKPDFHDVVLFLRQWLKLIVRLQKKRPSVAYLPISQSAIGFLRDSCLIFPAWLAGANVVLHLHGGNFKTWFDGRSFLMKAYIRMVLHCVSYVAILGESLRPLFDGLIANDRVVIVPNGLHWPGISKSERIAKVKRRYTVLHLSTLNRLKGATVLLAAIPLVLKIRQNVEFVFAGPWSHEEDWREAETFVAQHQVGNYIVFTGPVTSIEQKRLVYSSADLFVFPGVQQEGQPLVTLEAMASGLPVVFTNRGCLKETVVEGECGLEVRINDPQHLADRILWCLDHPEEMERMGRNARHRFEQCYTIDQFIRRLGDLFAQACYENSPPSVGSKSAAGSEKTRCSG